MNHPLEGASLVAKTLYRILRPLARLLLMHGTSIDEATQILRIAYLDSAENDFQLEDEKKVNKMRVSILTGMSRVEIDRLKTLYEQSGDTEKWIYKNRAGEVVAGWVQDSKYHRDNGKYADLPLLGKEKSFEALVKEKSGGSTHPQVLKELLRAGTVEKLLDGKIRLLSPTYIPHHSNEERMIHGGYLIDKHIRTVIFNLYDKKEEDNKGRFHRFASLKVPKSTAKEFKQWVRERQEKEIIMSQEWLYERSSGGTSVANENGHTHVGVGAFIYDD